MEMKHISFLFGSGISLASAAQSVEELTQSVLHDRWLKTCRETFIPDGPVRSDDPPRRAAEALLELVHRGLDGALLAAVAAAHPVAAAQLV